MRAGNDALERVSQKRARDAGQLATGFVGKLHVFVQSVSQVEHRLSLVALDFRQLHRERCVVLRELELAIGTESIKYWHPRKLRTVFDAVNEFFFHQVIVDRQNKVISRVPFVSTEQRLQIGAAIPALPHDDRDANPCGEHRP